MKEFLNELARLWWIEVGTNLTNPLSEQSIDGLRTILKEEYDFDSEVIEYIVESAVKTPTNFHLGGNRESGMQVGQNDTAVSAHLHSDEDDDKDGAIDYDEPIEEEEKDEEKDSTDKERPDTGDGKEKVIKNLKKGALTALEKDKLVKENWWSDMTASQQQKYIQDHPKSQKAQDAKEKKKDKDTSTVSKLNKELKGEQEKTSKLRDEGIAGAGGESASQGESRFCNAVDTLDEKKFKKENRESVDKKVSEFKDGKIDGKKRPNKEDTDVLGAVGFEKPYSDEAFEYLAGREVFAEKELQRIIDTPNPNVFTKGSGFGGDKKAYMSWMRAAYDGALSTKHHLENDTKMDTSKGYQTIQSTTDVDNKVESNLEKKANDPNLSDEDRVYYQKELKSFQKFRKYHDTYVVGVDENGRDYIVSVSNKKDSNLNDPQNNTTPAARFEVIKKQFGEETAKKVTDSIDNGIKKVTTVAENTTKGASQIEVDDDFIDVLEVAGGKYVKLMESRGLKRKRSKSGKPARGSEFGCYLEDNNVSTEQWNKMSTKERVKLSQKYMGDTEYHNETQKPPYDFAKMFIKVGEVNTGGHRELNKIRAKLEKAGKSSVLESDSVKNSGNLKRDEQNSVKEAHQSVVNDITEADKEKGFPKDGKNGPNTQAYIGTVMSAMHYDTYIDMDDDDDDKILLQMGVRGAKASHIRNCLASKSGYDLKNGNRDGLKKHLREKSSINAETGAIVIKSENEDGKPTSIADDTWRTAGTSQKVASGFGSDMKTCVKSNVDTDRKN